jgi:hypothetical protein
LNIKKEALYCLSNAIANADTITREIIIENDKNRIIPSVLSNALTMKDNKLLGNIMESVQALIELDSIFHW